MLKSTVRVKDHVVKTEIEIPFFDVDSMQIVWHGNYLKYFELARTALFKTMGLTPNTIQTMPYKWVVIESKCRHPSALKYGDVVVVEAQLIDVEYRIKVSYKIRNKADGKVAAKGYTVLATLDSKNNMLIETPPEVLALLTEKA